MTNQPWLITGGAGYIGSHVADEFLSNGKDVVIYDSLHKGLRSRIEFLQKKHMRAVPLIVGDIRDTKKLARILISYQVCGVIHTAALKSVDESFQKSDEYLEVNFHATAGLIEVLKLLNLRNLIFSSTAAVYGSPNSDIAIKENSNKSPISPYGESKLFAENEINQFLATPGHFGTSLRFFNVVGTSSQSLTDNSIENLVPIALGKINGGKSPIVYGADYSTFDGTCIRDYVDVRDVARAHLLVAGAEKPIPNAMNVGTGQGRSVLEVINLISSASEATNVTVEFVNRRKGDSQSLWADVSLIKTVLDFKTQYSLEESIGSLFSRVNGVG